MDPPVEDDLEFDFFEDEPATQEAQRMRLPRRAQRGPRRPVGPPRGVAPLVRLFVLVLFVIFLVLVFALLLQSCASQSRHDAYAHYMDKVDGIASESSAHGRALADALTTPGVKVAGLEAKLRGIADQEQQNVDAAHGLNPPGRLRTENDHLVEALQLRVSGVTGLADTFQQTSTSKSSGDASLLSTQADRLIASDVVWDDLFKDPATTQLKRDGVNGVSPPESHFVVNRDLLTADSMSKTLERLRGASTGGTPTGLHGTNIVSVKALPGGKTLSTGTDNDIIGSTSTAFEVTIADSGDSQEVQIEVTLTIQKSGGPIVKNKTIDLINPGQQKTVTFTNLGNLPFAQKTTVKVDVKPVPGEHNTSNNTASYPVIFSLG
jgi:hypothetical protein